MRSRNSLLCGVLLAAITALVTALVGDSSAQTEQSPPTLVKLHEQIAALEARVATLEAQQTGVQQAAGGAQPSISVPLPRDDSPSSRLPDGWKRSEINGVPFYTVPLSQQSLTE